MAISVARAAYSAYKVRVRSRISVRRRLYIFVASTATTTAAAQNAVLYICFMVGTGCFWVFLLSLCLCVLSRCLCVSCRKVCIPPEDKMGKCTCVHLCVHGQTLAAVWRLLPVPFGASCPLLALLLGVYPLRQCLADQREASTEHTKRSKS